MKITKRKIPYGRQWITESDIREVVRTLRSDFITQGPVVTRFEKALAEYAGSKYAVAVANGTAALHIAVSALGFPVGFEGITSPITFVASSNAMLYNSGKPVFADIDPTTGNISPESIEKKITSNTRLIIPVDLAGLPCDMDKISALARKNNLKIIRDSSHSIGSKFHNVRTGSCATEDMTTFSFHPVKQMTTGEGGAVLTNDPVLYEKLSMLRSHGITRDPSRMLKNEGLWYYEMQTLGYNYRLTDFQCALGIAQLKKLDRFIWRRREIAALYDESFKGLNTIRTFIRPSDRQCSWHLYIVLIDFKKLGMTRNTFMEKLRDRGVYTQVHYIPVHLQPYYRDTFGTGVGDCPQAEKYYEDCLSLPMYPAMNNRDVRHVVRSVCSLLEN